MRKSLHVPLSIILIFILILQGCSIIEPMPSNEFIQFSVDSENVPLISGLFSNETPKAEATGDLVIANDKVHLDYSNTGDGYVMLKYTGLNNKVKTLITGPSGVTYTYNQSHSESFDVYPLSDGNGSYKISVYENSSGNSYYAVFSNSIFVTLKDEFQPFIRANKYVNYSTSGKVAEKSMELCKNKTSTLEKIGAIYEFVINTFSYDYQLAKTVKSGYIPDLEVLLDKKTGICFDYAAIMTAMLRLQGIPTKMVFGYTGSIYHAWISVYSEESGWITAAIYFNGKEWKLMDPTFASNANSSVQIMQYIGNGENYTAKFLY